MIVPIALIDPGYFEEVADRRKTDGSARVVMVWRSALSRERLQFAVAFTAAWLGYVRQERAQRLRPEATHRIRSAPMLSAVV